MNLRRRKSRPLTREERTRRDDRIFVIATEDTHAAKQYFDALQIPRVKVQVLPTEDGLSSPEHVLRRLDNFVDQYELIEDDERWLMLDTDHWTKPNHIATFTEVCKQAKQKGVHLAHSNPCFELWLLLHVTDVNPNEQFEKCRDVERRLKEILGAYNKRNIDCSQFPWDTIRVAVARAEKLDQASRARWPRKTGSHVYRVVKKLLQGYGPTPTES